MPDRTSHTPGTISWADLATTDQEAAKEFYGGLFGWEYDEQPVGEGQTYSMAKLGGRSAAAIASQQPDETAAGHPAALERLRHRRRRRRPSRPRRASWAATSWPGRST